MEPISIAASIYSLIEAGKKTIQLISSIVDAPQTALNVLREVETLQVTFRQVQGIISDRGQQSVSRRERISLDDLVFTLTSCVCVFSELDRALESLGAQTVGQKLTAWDKAKWAAREGSIEKILRNLQMNKISLQCMVSIYLWFATRILFFHLI